MDGIRRIIYINAEDVVMFDEAIARADGNVSHAITAAVKAYVEAKEAEEEVVLEVGWWNRRGADDTKRIAFKGRLLAETTSYTGQTSLADDRGIDWQVYSTEKGKYLVWWKEWSRWDGEGDFGDYAILRDLPPRGKGLYGKETDSMSPGVPGSLIEEAAKAAGQDAVERLDV